MASNKPIHRLVVVKSEECAVSAVCDEILERLESEDFSREDVFSVHLAVEEALTNALSHGNRKDTEKKIEVEYCVDSDKVEVSVGDEGEGFDPEAVPDPREGDNIYKNEGRGLLLMRSYMDVVEFNERGNKVRMVRYKRKQRTKEGTR